MYVKQPNAFNIRERTGVFEPAHIVNLWIQHCDCARKSRYGCDGREIFEWESVGLRQGATAPNAGRRLQCTAMALEAEEEVACDGYGPTGWELHVLR